MNSNTAIKQLESGHVYLDAEQIENYHVLQNGFQKAHILTDEALELADWWDPDKKEVGGQVPTGDAICGRNVLGRPAQKQVPIDSVCRDCYEKFVMEAGRDG